MKLSKKKKIKLIINKIIFFDIFLIICNLLLLYNYKYKY